MRLLGFLFPIALIVLQALAENAVPVITVPKSSLPYAVTSSSTFVPANFPSAYCRASIDNDYCFTTMVQCDDKSKPTTDAKGNFMRTSCMTVSCKTAVAAYVTMTCATSDFALQQTLLFKLVVEDSAPTCQNVTYSFASGNAVIFQLHAGDFEDTALQYHIRQASFEALNGSGAKLDYCQNCDDNTEEWKPYADLLQQSFLSKWSRKFRYTPPPITLANFSTTLQFTATDLSNNDCVSDGFVTFTQGEVTPPSGKSVSYSSDVFIGIPRTIKISGTAQYEQRLAFGLKTVPSADCAILCRIPDTARAALKLSPGTVISGSELDASCSSASALSAGSDITISGKSDSFAYRTFLTIKTFKACSASFDVTVSEAGVLGTPATVTFSATQMNAHSCKPLTLTADKQSFQLKDVFDSPPGIAVIVSVLSGQATLSGQAISKKKVQPTDSITIPSMSQTLRLEITNDVSNDASSTPFDEYCAVVVGLPAQTPIPRPPPTPSPPSGSGAPSTPQPAQQSNPTPAPVPQDQPTGENANAPAESMKARVLWFFVLVGIAAISYAYRKVIIAVLRQLCGGAKYRPLGQEAEMGRR